MSATVSRSLWVGCLVVSGRLAVDNAQQGLKPQKNATRRGQQCCWTACATVPFWRRSSVGATARKHQFLITHTDNSELRKSCLLLTCCGLVSGVPNERELYWRILPSWITKHEAKQQPQNQCAQQDLMVSQFPWEKKNGSKSGQKENLTRVGRHTGGNPFIYNLLCLETGVWRQTYFLQECVEWG